LTPTVVFMCHQVRVYYTGRLASGKIFDSATTGNGFKFKFGKKEVISGWDVGLSGMLLYITVAVLQLYLVSQFVLPSAHTIGFVFTAQQQVFY